ncbi:T9SS sorting signal type C domain-containing protein [Flavobacterium sp. J372]|uniref:T9SS sorting signal type C domain-containing protein n=1 Tax=Flavobacterium sp. J372 TaxID=2898436 RepID=UPI002151E625|nr:T9SS sorting signal type C domain-containing protein [Flavobacterium sp. J372]MCR5861276.1 T9SS sorting signal type C domain-containing protein [Flavobacterium sp. J372]
MKKILLSATHRIDLTIVLMLLMSIGIFAQSPGTTVVTPNTSVTFRTVITITGTGLTNYTVRFNNSGTDATLISRTNTQILVAVPSFTVTAPATTTSLTLNLRRNSVNYPVASLTYHAPSNTVVNNAKVSRLYTDWQGYWTSNNTTTVLANQPDRQHSLTALEYGGITYSTGVADAVLSAKGISYTAADFKALPVNSISGTTPSSSGASNYFAMASKMDGSASSAIATAPEVAGRKAKDVLIDGIKGLGIGTGMTNMSTSSIFEFVVSDIAESRINDGEPDLVVSQVAEPTSGDNDIYCFVDSNGNIVGRPVSVTMQNIPAIGTYKLDLFNITFNSTYDVATLTNSAGISNTNTTRPIRLVGYKLSDFGITAENMESIAGFKIMPSGISDPAFIAYNANSMLIPSPKINTQPTSVVACTGTGTSTSFTVNATGINLTYQWKKNGVSLVNGGNISGATTATLNITNVSASDVAFYTCEVTNAAGSVLSNEAYLNTIIAVQPIDNTACLNVTGPYVEVIANGLNLTYQWYSNTTASNTGGTLIPGATNYYYVPPVNAAGITYYYVVIDNNGLGCVRETSTAAKFTVGTAATSGNSYIGGTAGVNNNITTTAICSGTTVTLRNTGSTGTNPTYLWEQSTDGIGGWNTVTGGTGSTTVAYTTPALTETTYYRMRVKTASCEVYSNILKVSVGAEAGVIEASSKVICTGTSTTVSVTGSTTTIQWQQSTNGTTWVNVTGGSGATTETYTTPVLTSTTYYRTIVTGVACSNPNSDPIQVIVNPGPVAGTVSANKSICTGTSTTVRLTGATGTIQWQVSSDNNSFTDIPGATNDVYTTGVLTQTRYYRAIVTAVGCSSTSTSAVTTVTVSSPAVIGSVSSSSTICAGNSTVLSATGVTGTPRWQQSPDGVSNWVNTTSGTGGSTLSYTTPALTSTSYYRLRATNGGCVEYSQTITVTVTPISAGTAGSNQSVCTGGTATVTVSGTTGSIQWQQSADGSTGWANVTGGSGATTASYTTPALSSQTYYRALVTNGSCSVTSGVITVSISTPTAGTASGTTTICSGSTANLSLSGNTGSIQWQQSANGTTGWATVTGGSGATTANYTTAALTSTTYYRAQLTNGSCTAESNVITVTVTNISAGTAGSNQAICSGNTATVSVSGTVGNIQWQQSADGLTNWTSVTGGSGATTASYTTGALTATTYYRAQVTNGACSVTSGVITVSVSSVTTGTASGSTSLCPGVTTTLSLSGHSGNIQWQQSSDGLTNWVNVTGGTGATSASYTTAAMNSTTYYRAQVTSGSCASASNVVTVSRNNNFIWNGSVSSDWHNPANWSCNAIPTLVDNAIIPQQTNQPIVSQNIMAYAKTLDIQAGAILTINIMRNITVQDGIAVASTGNMIVNNRANLVQITENSSNNTGNINVKRNSSQLYRQDYTLWSSPVTGQKLFQFSPLTLPDRFYTYRDSARLYMKVPNLSAQSTTTFTKGVAYLIRMPNGNSTPGYNAGTTAITLNQQFTGVPNNGIIHIPVVHEWTPQSPVAISNYGYNGVGNPYPSTINIHSFIDANSAPNNDVLETGTLYFWRKKNNNNNTSYTAINKAGYVENGAEGGNVGAGFIEGDEANWVINPGQGFIVQTKVGANHIEFNNTMRRAVNNSQFFRNTQQPVVLSRIWLNLTSSTGVYAQTLVGYSNATTDGFDFGYDSPLFTDGVAAIYTKGAGKDLSIQAKGVFADADVVPLHYRINTAGQYTISLHKKDGLFADGQNVYLRDNQTNTVQDLNAGSYTFTAGEGVTENRFDVIYVTDGVLGTTNPQLNDKAIVAFKDNGILKVSTEGHDLDNVKVFDIRGRLLTEKKAINSSSTALEGFTAQEQMLILQVRTKDGAIVSKKVIF